MLLVLLALASFSFPATPPLAAASITLATPGDAVDGEVHTTVLLFGKVGHPAAYTALVHALPAGKHGIVAQPSPYWTWPSGAAAPALTVVQAPQSIVIARAPALWVRADTIGTSTDLPLLMYAEDLRVNGTGVLRYSVIFSNEDGGTATPALLARWG